MCGRVCSYVCGFVRVGSFVGKQIDIKFYFSMRQLWVLMLALIMFQILCISGLRVVYIFVTFLTYFGPSAY